MHNHQSWGNYPRAHPRHVYPMHWRHESVPFDEWDTPVLPYAYGRSYGDSCQNNGGTLLATTSLRHFIAFDEERGILRCESGVSFAEILAFSLPRGWFLPVTPGTQYVSVGGAIANDVHGKNHHTAGTFGRHVLRFELLRSTGERYVCTPDQQRTLFGATIGGLGLTGLILWADIQLKPVRSPAILSERKRFMSLDEFFELTEDSDRTYEYTVAWIDCLAGEGREARGVFIRGNHDEQTAIDAPLFEPKRAVAVPCPLPSSLLNTWTLKCANTLYYRSHSSNFVTRTEPYETFFYPLDRLTHWNRLYGSRGFLQYQCVIPPHSEREGIRTVLDTIYRAQQGSFLAVLKRFGSLESPGWLSFPRPGTTLALDFPCLGDTTLALLRDLDAIVRAHRGAVYPAKDARMSAEDFQTFFPRWKEFLETKDPEFSSSLWRRVTPSHPDAQHPRDVCTDAPHATTSTVARITSGVTL